MGASREGCSIWREIQYKNWKKVRLLLSDLIIFWRRSNRRSYIIKDTFKTPFNKRIGCKLFGHRWSTEEEFTKYDLHDYLCWKCSKRENSETRKSNNRSDKIEKILK